ncbi:MULTISPECIES: mobile mystery protein B [unclassified Devosia]|uniref:mobile mystery protein B n=1 Tax=unclassified Devosia TaxID=196773 RepID=UPI0009593FEF|nr:MULTISPECIES: mobile mystery protein B [unclassified Devosia]MBN9364503.1 mobile mystery protein B [Devosia sp.]OJX20719.1 MAG: cell filamentation protein Fic [Devosia sp. 66-14]
MSDIVAAPEGATLLDPDELEGLRYRHITTREQLNELEQANLDAGLLWLGRQKQLELTVDQMCRLHARLFGEVWNWAGTFRRTEKTIGVDPLQIGVQSKILMDDVAWWAEHNTFSPTEAALRFHHRLVQIHLFPNGNGRHARIAADALLEKRFKAPPIDWSGGADLTRNNQRRTQYILALRAADLQDYRPLLVFAGL